MEAEKGFAYCGLACCVCSDNGSCAGCRRGGCAHTADCAIAACCRRQDLPGCWACAEFPCGQPMLQKPRVRAFCRFLGQEGEEALLAALRRGEAAGYQYHYPGLLTGDYDAPEDEAAILALLRQL